MWFSTVDISTTHRDDDVIIKYVYLLLLIHTEIINRLTRSKSRPPVTTRILLHIFHLRGKMTSHSLSISRLASMRGHNSRPECLQIIAQFTARNIGKHWIHQWIGYNVTNRFSQNHNMLIFFNKRFMLLMSPNWRSGNCIVTVLEDIPIDISISSQAEGISYTTTEETKLLL